MSEEKDKKFREFRREVKKHLGISEDFEKSDNLLDIVERQIIQYVFTLANGNQSEAARLLGMSRYQLRYRAEKHGFLKPKRRPRER